MADWWELKSKGQGAQSDRKLHPVSTAELERRWAALRAAMAEEAIDVLIFQASHNYLGGYVRWLTDTPAKFGFQDTVIFPRDDLMTVIRHGPDGGDFAFDGSDPVQRGVKQLLTEPFYGSVNYMRHWAGELAAKALEGRNGQRIGLVATDLMSASFVDHLGKNLPAGVELVDGTDLIDEIRARKSPEEQELLRATARTQDLAFQAVLAAIKPGMRDFEVTAAARYACELLGSEDGLYLGSSGPPNTSAGLLRRPNMQGAAVVEGGYYTILIECAGPGGLYSELARSVVLGEPSREQQDELAIVCEAQDNTAQLLRPGADPAEICRLHAEFMQGRDRPAEVRNYAHGQGYDVMERPLIRPEETMTIGEDMCFAVHPSYATATAYAFVCDNFMVMPQGPAMRLHQTPQKVFSA